jgi:hypothetical protein
MCVGEAKIGMIVVLAKLSGMAIFSERHILSAFISLRPRFV